MNDSLEMNEHEQVLKRNSLESMPERCALPRFMHYGSIISCCCLGCCCMFEAPSLSLESLVQRFVVCVVWALGA